MSHVQLQTPFLTDTVLYLHPMLLSALLADGKSRSNTCQFPALSSLAPLALAAL